TTIAPLRRRTPRQWPIFSGCWRPDSTRRRIPTRWPTATGLGTRCRIRCRIRPSEGSAMGDGDPLVMDPTSGQYKKPASVRESGWFGTPYANEHDPSWEDVIAMVVIPGEPDRITAVADTWALLFTRMSEVKRVLD